MWIRYVRFHFNKIIPEWIKHCSIGILQVGNFLLDYRALPGVYLWTETLLTPETLTFHFSFVLKLLHHFKCFKYNISEGIKFQVFKLSLLYHCFLLSQNQWPGFSFLWTPPLTSPNWGFPTRKQAPGTSVCALYVALSTGKTGSAASVVLYMCVYEC